MPDRKTLLDTGESRASSPAAVTGNRPREDQAIRPVRSHGRLNSLLDTRSRSSSNASQHHAEATVGSIVSDNGQATSLRGTRATARKSGRGKFLD